MVENLKAMAGRKPSFLIVGAMKSATTSLFEDLASHPEIFAPPEKEPGYLCPSKFHEDEIHEQYSQLFKGAEPNQLCFEASTFYTMYPAYQGVIDSAKNFFDGGLKIIYLIREPVARTLSHHAHAYARKDCCEDINKAVIEYPYLIDFSKYFSQIEPWMQAFGKDQVLILPQDAYISSRRKVLQAIESFLGVSERNLAREPSLVANSRTSLSEDSGLSMSIRQSGFYRKVVRGFLSPSLRGKLKTVVMKKVPKPTTEMSEVTADYIREAIVPEIDEIKPYVSFSKEAKWL